MSTNGYRPWKHYGAKFKKKRLGPEPVMGRPPTMTGFKPDDGTWKAVLWLRERTGRGTADVLRLALKTLCASFGATLDYPEDDTPRSQREPGRPRVQGHFFPPKEAE